MILSFLKMAMVICNPLVLIFAPTTWANVVRVTAVQFSLSSSISGSQPRTLDRFHVLKRALRLALAAQQTSIR